MKRHNKSTGIFRSVIETSETQADELELLRRVADRNRGDQRHIAAMRLLARRVLRNAGLPTTRRGLLGAKIEPGTREYDAAHILRFGPHVKSDARDPRTRDAVYRALRFEAAADRLLLRPVERKVLRQRQAAAVLHSHETPMRDFCLRFAVGLWRDFPKTEIGLLGDVLASHLYRTTKRPALHPQHAAMRRRAISPRTVQNWIRQAKPKSSGRAATRTILEGRLRAQPFAC